MNEDLKVSLIIPTYKDDEALNLILNALTYQTYSNFEVIVAEDSKEDSTQNLLKNYTLTLNNALTPP